MFKGRSGESEGRGGRPLRALRALDAWGGLDILAGDCDYRLKCITVFFSDRGQDGALRGALNKPFLIRCESLLKALVACDRGPPMAAHNCSLEPFLEGRAHSKVVSGSFWTSKERPSTHALKGISEIPMVFYNLISFPGGLIRPLRA